MYIEKRWEIVRGYAVIDSIQRRSTWEQMHPGQRENKNGSQRSWIFTSRDMCSARQKSGADGR